MVSDIETGQALYSVDFNLRHLLTPLLRSTTYIIELPCP